MGWNNNNVSVTHLFARMSALSLQDIINEVFSNDNRQKNDANQKFKRIERIVSDTLFSVK